MRTDSVEARRIGLVSDTHDDFVDWPAVRAKIAAALEGVDLVVHCGDVTSEGALDDLARVAPVMAVRSAADPAPSPPRLVDGPRLIEVGPWTIAVVNALPEGQRTAGFDMPVDAVVFGGTHRASVERVDDVLFVNPGSPSLADRTSVAILELGAGGLAARVIDV